MIFVHHFMWFLMASIGMILAYFSSNIKFLQHDFIRYFILFFGIGLFIHVFLIDAPSYSHMFENNVSAYDNYIVQGKMKPDYHRGSLKTISDRVFHDPWNTTYIKRVDKDE